MVTGLFSAFLALLSFFVSYIAYLEREKIHLAEISALKLQLSLAESEKTLLLSELSNRVSSTQTQPSFLTSTDVFYVAVGILFVVVSFYVIYSAIHASNSLDVVLDCTKTTDASLGDNEILVETISNIDINLANINNVSLVALSEKLTAAELKINEILFKLSCLSADKIPAHLDDATCTMLQVVQDKPELIFTII